MALVRLAAEYAQKAGAELFAFTVDHGLRPASAGEAAQAAAWCQALGLSHETLVWRGDKPAAGVQEAARAARYFLLARAAAAVGADVLMTGHSADDQAETVFMRLARGAGPRGLSAMDDEIAIAAGAGPAVRLARPLLAFSRARLTATVKALGQPFVDDPSNDDPGFERIRTRALLAALEQNGSMTSAALTRAAARMRDGAARLKRAEEEAFSSLGGCFYRWGGASLDLQAVAARAPEAPRGLARRLVHAVSGEVHAPDRDAAGAALEGALNTGAATLGGALVRVWRGKVWFLREPAALLGRAGIAPRPSLALAPGAAALWDGRFIIEAASADLAVKALDGAARETPEPRLGLFGGPPEGLAAAPGIFRAGALIATPASLSVNASGVFMRPLAAERFAGKIIRYR